MGARERLEALLGGPLDFHGEDSSYASHNLHAFAAKFPPQLPRVFIRGLTEPGDTVLDPMMGSGTAIVEATLEGRHGIGVDIDPLALHLSRVKTTPVDPAELRSAGNRVLSQAHAHALVSDPEETIGLLQNRFDVKSRAFIDYWFLERTQHELIALISAIEQVTEPAIRRFLELTLSKTIVTKSGGVSRARDLAHTRPHLVKSKEPRSALAQFSRNLGQNIESIRHVKAGAVLAEPLAGDARSLPLADETVDLLVTSPPYANAIDYMRAHKFSLVWLGESITKLASRRASYIGSERIGGRRYGALPEDTELVIRQLADKDQGKSLILRKYLVEMKAMLSESLRVLKRDSAAVMVVGTSTMRGIDVQTHQCLIEIARGIGFDIVGVTERALDRDKRMMPARRNTNGGSMIEQRMNREYVIGLVKPPR